MNLRATWYKYVNDTHFVIGSFAVWVGQAVNFPWWIAAAGLLVGGFLHEWIDGDLFGKNVLPAELSRPWEGIKDWAWFLVPLLWRVV